MDFILPFRIKPFPFTISYRDKIILIGSCFSEEIGYKMKSLKFDVLQNPNGILYHPISICQSLSSTIENKKQTEKDIFEFNGLWHSWQHHSIFSGVDKNEVLDTINQAQSTAHNLLKKSTYLVITFGSAFYYQLKNDKRAVANCHKAPADWFEKFLMPVDSIIDDTKNILSLLNEFNPGLKIIFTVSPVRHVKDGVIENNRSKARLIEAIHSIIEATDNCFYFPSYELVTDILRDYRFYKNDLVHPNETAIEYVFEKFCEAAINAEEKEIMTKVQSIIHAVEHKPFSKESAPFQKFAGAQIKIIEHLQDQFPSIDLSSEKKYFEEYLLSE
ncbi:MAG: GSCFA domain-containing protein [Ginsengibacter sp.]